MTRVVSILGGEKELGRKIQNPIDFDSLIRKGMPPAALYHVKETFDLSDETMANIIGVSLRTVARRRAASNKRHKPAARLSPVESDRLYRFARILALAEDVFERGKTRLSGSTAGNTGWAAPYRSRCFRRTQAPARSRSRLSA